MTIQTKLDEAIVGVAGSALVAMSFTPSEITALTVATGALVAAVFAGVVNIIVALRAEKKVDHVIAKTEDIRVTGEVIKGHVNSASSAAKMEIDSLQQQISKLTALIADRKQIDAVLAQAKADTAAAGAVATHDTWERDQQGKDAESLATNTEPTKEILDIVKEKGQEKT